MKSLRHYNGQPVLEIYGNHALNDDSKQGPIVTVNVSKCSRQQLLTESPTGEYVSFAEVEKAAADAHIHVHALSELDV